MRKAGQQGVMHDVPMLFDVGDSVRLESLGKTIQIKGHARFSYGRGFWDEFWGIGAGGQSYWVSVDEGDVVFQYVLAGNKAPKRKQMPNAGAAFQFRLNKYRVVEVEQAECVSLRGAFGEALTVGETYQFVNAQGPGGALLSGEYWADGNRWYLGHWVSPFDVKILKSEGSA